MPSSPLLEGWMPTAFGALDIAGEPGFAAEAEILLVPAQPGPALCLVSHGAHLWRRLVEDGPLPAAAFDDADLDVLAQWRTLGIVAFGSDHPARMRRLSRPVLSSPLHELVYAVTVNVAAGLGIRTVFIKGPALRSQGLREREHSADVDVWCDPARTEELAEALAEWGWRRSPDPWSGTPVPHSTTMSPTSWGCEIDVHRRVPGLALDDASAFEAVSASCVTTEYAGTLVRIPTAAVHAVLAAVNAVRPAIGGRGRPAEATTAAVRMLTAADGSLDRARELGAVSALRDELTEAFGAGSTAGSAMLVPRDWQWRGRPDTAHAYLAALRSLPISDRPRVILRLLWPDDDVALASARRAGDPTDDPRRARLRRLLRGLREWGRGRRDRLPAPSTRPLTERTPR
ncbi:MAG: hypothetical protein BGO45_15365 [Microbacterium sp. 71-36]|uniref:hypothetical protein n=1 Tax=unclassified Microbacterium TaxID=2609290 RepID=UPI0008686BC1|nr:MULTISPECIES: hypothetical protein [unclassified Microbacterium]MBN9212051.1 hypothetical protein [Microbacterium sp.]ODT37974.1 MAG: hypothetical protein ABS60_11635 [Microbacterium sp. SCN 71-17]OJV78057.1 MAG: hypothetical protein BGO45_15365 [Microbacterium sp. 71-36]